MDKPTVKIKRKLLFLVVFTIGIVSLMFKLRIRAQGILQELT